MIQGNSIQTISITFIYFWVPYQLPIICTAFLPESNDPLQMFKLILSLDSIEYWFSVWSHRILLFSFGLTYFFLPHSNLFLNDEECSIWLSIVQSSFFWVRFWCKFIGICGKYGNYHMRNRETEKKMDKFFVSIFFSFGRIE